MVVSICFCQKKGEYCRIREAGVAPLVSDVLPRQVSGLPGDDG